VRETGPHTWDDYVALTDEDDFRELWDGWLVEPEECNAHHEYIVAALALSLVPFTRRHGGGALLSGFKVKIDHHNGVYPDAQLYRRGRRPPPQSYGTEVPPDLVVEVISPGKEHLDRILKRDAYARCGVPEYWIIDPELEQFERLVLNENGAYDLAEVLTGDVTFSSSTFPDLVVDLAELWHYEEASAAE
jgi:Uma2 family endonuclease